MLKTQTQALGQYYTASQFGHLLVNSLEVQSPDTILELGAGEGSLLTAAQNRWDQAKIISVDIDHKNHELINGILPGHSHFLLNALDKNLSKSIGVQSDSVDVAVCNPPYIKSKWKSSFSELLEEAGLSNCLSVHSDFSTDILFLAQNIRLLRKGGELGIIVPDGLVAASKASRLREQLIKNHMLSGVIQLPTKIFQKTEAKTYVLILKKDMTSDGFIPLYKASKEGVIGDPIFIFTEQAVNRLDYDHYFYSKAIKIDTARVSSHKQSFSQEKPLFEIARGNITKVDAQKNNIDFFHTTDFKYVKNINSCHLSDKTKKIFNKNNHIVAEKGDILLARVGRDLDKKMALVTAGQIILSDCVYRIRPQTPEIRKRLWSFISSKDGRLWIKAHSKGVCAQSINKSDLVKLPIL